MHSFKVVREQFGWAVRLGPAMTTPFWSQAAALREANALCTSLRSHGVAAEVVAEEEDQGSQAATRNCEAASVFAIVDHGRP